MLALLMNLGFAASGADAVAAVSYSIRSERIVMPPQNRDVIFARDDRSIFVGADNRGIKH
jgi:hypothetical protein